MKHNLIGPYSSKLLIPFNSHWFAIACHGLSRVSVNNWKWQQNIKDFHFQTCTNSNTQDSFSLLNLLNIMFDIKEAYYIFSTHPTVASLSYSSSQKGKQAAIAKVAPDHGTESAKAHTRVAFANYTNRLFSCSLFIGLHREQEPQTLFHS